jgi:hypothetical protein
MANDRTLETMKRVTATVFTSGVPVFVYWLGGGAFERDHWLAITGFMSILLGAWQWYAPWWWLHR